MNDRQGRESDAICILWGPLLWAIFERELDRVTTGTFRRSKPRAKWEPAVRSTHTVDAIVKNWPR